MARLAYGVGWVQAKRIFQHRLVGVVTIHPDTQVEEQIFVGELVLDVPCHVDRLERGDRVGLVAGCIFLVEEIVDAGVAQLGRTVVVVTEVADVGTCPEVVQFLGAEHAQTVHGRIVGVDVQQVCSVGVQAQLAAQIAVECTGLAGVKSLGVVDGVLEDPVAVNGRGTGEVQFANGVVLETAHQGPKAVAAHAECTVNPLLVFQTGHQLVSFDFEVGRCRDAELVVLEDTVVRGNGTHVVEQAVDAVGGLSIQQTATLTNVLQIGRTGTQQTLTNQVVVGLGVVGQNRIVLRTLKHHRGIQVQQLAPAG